MKSIVQKLGGSLASATRQPEPNVLLFAFLLNLPWELLQIPLFKAMPTLAHWDGVMVCLRAAAGDGVIALLAFWAIALLGGTRNWIARLSIRTLCTYVVIGLLFTVVVEYWATQVAGRWQYAAAMPRLPLLETGLLPLLQWVLIPPLLLWVVRRQLAQP